MSTTETLSTTDGSTSQSKMFIPQPGDLISHEVSGRNAVPIQSRRARKVPTKWPPELRSVEVARPPLSLKTGPTELTHAPQYEHAQEKQPHSAYTYNTFPSIYPPITRDTNRRQSTWSSPRRAYIPHNLSRGGVPPCNKLYVSNLPAETSQEELEDIFSTQPGYKWISFQGGADGPLCYVEFSDAAKAARALRKFYGWPLKNSRMGGIRLSFSKDNFGNRPPHVIVPRTPWVAPPPPLILPVGSPTHSAGTLESTGLGITIPRPVSPDATLVVESVSSPSIEEPTPRALEEKPDQGTPPVEAETGPHIEPLAGQNRPVQEVGMNIIRGPDYKIKTFDRFRLWLERAAEMELDWYPLPPIKQPVRLSQCRLVWTVSILRTNFLSYLMPHAADIKPVQWTTNVNLP